MFDSPFTLMYSCITSSTLMPFAVVRCLRLRRCRTKAWTSMASASTRGTVVGLGRLFVGTRAACWLVHAVSVVAPPTFPTSTFWRLSKPTNRAVIRAGLNLRSFGAFAICSCCSFACSSRMSSFSCIWTMTVRCFFTYCTMSSSCLRSNVIDGRSLIRSASLAPSRSLLGALRFDVCMVLLLVVRSVATPFLVAC